MKFEVDEIGGPDQVWVADITYVSTREGWLYLAVVLDLASRLVVGWSMSETLESSLAIDQLEWPSSGAGRPPGSCTTRTGA